MVALIHCFSGGNAGDGLLVELALERLARLGVTRDQMTIVALDPMSFQYLGARVVQAPGDAANRLSRQVLKSAAAFIPGAERLLEPARTVIREADSVIAVGGGYIQADSFHTSAGALLNHGHQLEAAARSDRPSLYLPQSIGPLHGYIGGVLRRNLQRIDKVLLRDDASMARFEGWPNVERIADMAVLKLAEDVRSGHEIRGGTNVLLIARPLRRFASYEDRLRALASKLRNPRWLVQSHVSSNKSDGKFIASLGFTPVGPATEVLSQEPPGVVVSVRLHGALQALIAGRPAVHLAYNSKGFAAYRDLGLDEFVHDANSFDPDVVVDQVAALQRDPSPMQRALHSRSDYLVRQSQRLTSVVAEAIAGK